MTTTPDAQTFQSFRPLLFSIAYRMLGSATEAEDILQDAYLRWAAASGEVRAPREYLSQVVNRLCLDRLKSARVQREQYVGPWLPEPVVTAGDETDPFRGIERKEAISLAFLRLLERLTPAERAVFLLHEVFEYPYDDIAAQLELTPANCRQLFHRAKERVRQERPRFTAPPDRQREFIERFLAAAQSGKVERFEQLLAEDATYHADGGGKAAAARKPVYGRHAVAKLLHAITQLALQQEDLNLTIEPVNGMPTLVAWAGGRLDSIYAFEIGEDAITGIEAVRNPDKLVYAAQQLRARQELPAGG